MIYDWKIWALLALGGTLLVMIYWTLSSWLEGRAESLLFGWAERNRYEVLRLRRLPTQGPFFWQRQFGQILYHVTVEDSDGFAHRGWVLCGYWVVGVLASRVRVVWEDDHSELSDAEHETTNQ